MTSEEPIFLFLHGTFVKLEIYKYRAIDMAELKRRRVIRVEVLDSQTRKWVANCKADRVGLHGRYSRVVNRFLSLSAYFLYIDIGTMQLVETHPPSCLKLVYVPSIVKSGMILFNSITYLHNGLAATGYNLSDIKYGMRDYTKSLTSSGVRYQLGKFKFERQQTFNSTTLKIMHNYYSLALPEVTRSLGTNTCIQSQYID